MIARAQFTISDLNDATNEVIVGTQTAATGAWTGVASFSELKDGQQIIYWLPYAGSGNATLELTLSTGKTTGAIPCYYSGATRLTTHYAAGNAIRLIYRVNASVAGTLYTGWWADANYDSNNYDRIRLNNAVTAKTAITAAHLIVGDDSGYFNLASGSVFSINHPLLYAVSAIAKAATGTNNYLAYPSINLRTTLGNTSWNATKTKTCYLVGTLSGELFTVASANWLTTAPNDANAVYISLGFMYSTYQMYLYPEHPMFRLVDGVLTAVSQMAYEASEAIANLEVGGRNFLLDSESERSYDHASTAELLIPVPFSEEIASSGASQFVFSAYVKAESKVQVGVYLYNTASSKAISSSDTAEATTEYQRVVLHIKLLDGYTAADAEAIYLRLSGATGTVFMRNLQMETGAVPSDWRAAQEDTEESLELKLAAVHAQISTEADSIRSEVQASYALASDMSQVREQVGTLAEQTQDNYTWSVSRITQLQDDLDAATEATEEQLNILRTYMTFGEDGLVIGKTGNPFTFRVVNDRLAFYMNNTEVAYLSNNKLYVTQAEILTKLQIGRFMFEPQSNGNLSLIYTG